jgi:hypothetical protein
LKNTFEIVEKVGSCYFYENSAECPAIYGGDECGAEARGMQSPSTPFKMPRVSTRGDSLFANRVKSAFKAQNKGENHGFGFHRQSQQYCAMKAGSMKPQ